MQKQYDVVVVGAGMVGALFAALLKDSPLQILVVEPSILKTPDAQAAFEPRVSALTQASEKLLTTVGAWDFIQKTRACAYQSMQVWDANGSESVHFSAQEISAPHLGVMVENNLVQHALMSVLKSAQNITVREGARVSDLEKYPQHWQVSLSSGEVLQTQLIVAADGGNSWVRERMGIALRTHDYQQKAIVTTVQTEKSHEFCARQCFTSTGPLAFLPLLSADKNTHYCSIVWSQNNAEADRLMALNEQDFCKELTRTFESRLGNVVACDPRFAFPLIAKHAETYSKDGVVLMGDAAHVIHPLAGQGVNIGFLDAAVLAEEILQAHTQNLAINHEWLLARYSRRRRAHNTVMQHSMTAFKKVFASHNPALVLARNQGFALTMQHSVIKQEIMRLALGHIPDAPKWLQ